MLHSEEIHQIDAINLSRALKKRLIDYFCDEKYINDDQLAGIIQDLWSGDPKMGGLISELWVEGAFPSRSSGLSLVDLVKEGVYNKELCKHLTRQGIFSEEKPLYSHQVKAIK